MPARIWREEGGRREAVVAHWNALPVLPRVPAWAQPPTGLDAFAHASLIRAGSGDRRSSWRFDSKLDTQTCSWWLEPLRRRSLLSRCNNSPAEWISAENGWRSSVLPIPRRQGRNDALASRQAWGSVTKPWEWSRVERPLVQILVVVANTQMRTLRTEVGKGSMWTAVGHGLVDPKR
jgi:hypothetical protein